MSVADCIALHNSHDFPVDQKRLKRCSLIVLEQHHTVQDSSLAIVISTADALRELNQRHRQIDAPTDVLSFPAPRLPAEISQSTRHLGDILVAYDYVSSRSREHEICLNDTLCLLVIHGTLHLLGYEHCGASEREQMWAAQSTALQSMGIDPAIVRVYGDPHHG